MGAGGLKDPKWLGIDQLGPDLVNLRSGWLGLWSTCANLRSVHFGPNWDLFSFGSAKPEGLEAQNLGKHKVL